MFLKSTCKISYCIINFTAIAIPSQMVARFYVKELHASLLVFNMCNKVISQTTDQPITGRGKW